eukprot:snap_masked-scaffold_7-processed-gene-1.20-mRNA-1 protein AED:1.00 eAED:1.00 QI:0/-1/0/0/-1/1/1/0/67
MEIRKKLSIKCIRIKVASSSPISIVFGTRIRTNLFIVKVPNGLLMLHMKLKKLFKKQTYTAKHLRVS